MECNKSKKIFINGAVWNTLGALMFGANSFVMLSLVSRFGTVEDAGSFGIAFTTAQLIYVLGLFGRNFYQQTDYQYKFSFSTYAVATVVSCLSMFLALFAFVKICSFSLQKTFLTAMLTLLMLLNVVGELFQSMFFQHNRLDISGASLFFRTFFSLMAFSTVYVVFKSVVAAVTVQMALNAALTIFFALKFAPRLLKEERVLENESGSVPRLLLECMPICVVLFLMNFLINMSKYGIELFMDDTVQGYYNMIFMPVQVINLCNQFIFKPFLKQYASMFLQKERHGFVVLLRNHIMCIGGIGFVCVVVSFFCGCGILGWFFNKDLTAQKLPLVTLILGGIVFAFNQMLFYVFLVMRQQKKMLCVYVFGVAFSMIISYALMNSSGLFGAAISFSLSQAFVFVLYSLFLWRLLRML